MFHVFLHNHWLCRKKTSVYFQPPKFACLSNSWKSQYIIWKQCRNREFVKKTNMSHSAFEMSQAMIYCSPWNSKDLLQFQNDKDETISGESFMAQYVLLLCISWLVSKYSITLWMTGSRNNEGSCKKWSEIPFWGAIVLK